jgi:hypothetical protein
MALHRAQANPEPSCGTRPIASLQRERCIEDLLDRLVEWPIHMNFEGVASIREGGLRCRAGKRAANQLGQVPGASDPPFAKQAENLDHVS